ncbi:hypothetical protein [Actinoplanes awajinensis]|uniref:Lipoprotein n=1 Tax=Actinoplanes awajinensis subsp. mycoplanecinus TaxID=135947 RepID=A0A0X3V485_9ACTN|nr:hypothetical protein [Actinoplanes awajinensis]KUL39488.1 hypothetical protein ADL15_09505 [Actinoplanes awajinensis subsp. mycoplanecinus]
MFSGINRSGRLAGAAAMVVLVSATAACGSASEAADGGSGDVGDTGMSVGSVHTEVTVEVTGAVTLKGTSKAPMPTNNGVDYTSCDQYGAGEKDDEGRAYFVLPQMLTDTIDGKTVFVGAMIKDYRGAGTYERGTLTDTGSPPGVSFGGELYFTQSNTTSTVTTDGKGGGSWVFTDLSTQNADGTKGGGGPAVSGTVSWTCAS